MDDQATIVSPCVKVCELDPEATFCIGCYRTIDEIAAWGTWSADQRAAVLRTLAARRTGAATIGTR
jgi:predicted Fe-S protein YdhL (DUF1289 family)